MAPTQLLPLLSQTARLKRELDFDSRLILKKKKKRDREAAWALQADSAMC